MITPSDALILTHAFPLLSSQILLCRLAHAGLFMGILYNTSSTNMFAKCVRILYGNITVLPPQQQQQQQQRQRVSESGERVRERGEERG